LRLRAAAIQRGWRGCVAAVVAAVRVLCFTVAVEDTPRLEGAAVIRDAVLLISLSLP